MELKVFETAKPLSQNQLCGLVYLYGDQIYLIDKLVEKILKKNHISLQDAVEFDGERLDLERLSEEVVTVSFAGSKICIVNHFLPENGKETVLSRLKELIDYLDEQNILIIKEQYRPEDKKNKRATAQKYRELAKSAGVLIDCNKPGTSVCIKYLKSFAQKQKIEVNSKELAYLFERCGENMLYAETELEKIGAYCSGRTMTRQDIDLLNTPSVEAAVFTMVNSLFSGDLSNALILLGRLLDQNEEPAKIVGALAGQFCDMYRIKSGEYEALSAKEIQELYGYRNNDFLYRKAVSNSRGFTIYQITKMLKILNQLDLELKSSSVDEQILLETALISLRLAMSERG